MLDYFKYKQWIVVAIFMAHHQLMDGILQQLHHANPHAIHVLLARLLIAPAVYQGNLSYIYICPIVIHPVQ